jgi:hypothetical protein
MQNMCNNIAKIYTTSVIINILKINSGIKESTQNVIVHILKTVMEQNHIQFEQKCYKQTEKPWVPQTSAKLAEANIQNIEHKRTYSIVIKHQIIGYFI